MSTTTIGDMLYPEGGYGGFYGPPGQGFGAPNTNPVYTTTTGTSGLNWQDGNGSYQDLSIRGDIKIQGKSITETLEKIERRLAILHPNPELEKRWKLLKDLGDQYREIEKDLLDKEKMWDILKK